MLAIQQSSTARGIPLPCFSGASPQSGITPTLKIKLHPTDAGSTPSGTITASDSSGFAELVPSATDFGTVGYYKVEVSGTGIDTRVIVVMVTAYDPFNVLPSGNAGASGGLPTLDSNLSVQAYLSTIGKQAVSRIVNRISGTVYFVSPTGNDASDGKSWDTAFLTPGHAASVAVAGDLILLGGMFDISATLTSFKPAAGVHVKGFGPNTGITSSVAGLGNQSICVFGGSVVWEDFAIIGTAASGVYQSPLGNSGTFNAVFRNLYLSGTTDCLYTAPTSGATARFYDCMFVSNWDFIAIKGGTNTYEFHNCTGISTGPCAGFVPLPAGAFTTTGVNVTSTNKVYFFGGSITVSGNDRQAAVGVDTASVWLFGTSISTYGTGTPMYDLLTQNGGTLYIADVKFGGTPKISGAVNTIPAFAYATDLNGAALATAANQNTLQTAVSNLNNLSALCNLYLPQQMEIPASGSITYPITITVKDSEGHLVDLSALPTVTATNAAGTDRSANLSAVTHAGTGVYTLTYTVSSTAAQEGLTIKASGTAASDSTARLAYGNTAAVAVDTTTTLTAIKAQTDKLTFTGSNINSAPQTAVTVGTNNDKTGYSLATPPPTAAEVATAVWQDTTAGDFNVAGSVGKIVFAQLGGAFTPGTSIFTGAALQNAPSGGGGGFSGPSAVTLIFHDVNGNPVPNVVFTVVGVGTAATDGSGQLTVGLNNGTYTVKAMPASGTLFASTSIDVVGAESFTITGTAAVIPSPPSGSQATAYAYAYDGSGNAVSGKRFFLKLVASNTGTNLWSSKVIASSASDNTGLATATVEVGASYTVSLDGSNWSKPFTIPSGTTYQIAELVGLF